MILVFDMRYLPISHAHIGSIAFGNLESSVQEAMVRHLGRGGAFYDIGANLGFFSLLGAHLSGLHDGHVYAFEAAPKNAEAIAVNAGSTGSTTSRSSPRPCPRTPAAAGSRSSTIRAGQSSRTMASIPTQSR